MLDARVYLFNVFPVGDILAIHMIANDIHDGCRSCQAEGLGYIHGWILAVVDTHEWVRGGWEEVREGFVV
jgi:hypothetical protein